MLHPGPNGSLWPVTADEIVGLGIDRHIITRRLDTRCSDLRFIIAGGKGFALGHSRPVESVAEEGGSISRGEDCCFSAKRLPVSAGREAALIGAPDERRAA